MNWIDEYEQAHPPEEFYVHEGRGQRPVAPEAGLTYEDTAPLTRDDREAAEAELASALGTSVSLVHEAALEASGIDPHGTTDFVSLTQHASALSQLALSTGVSEGGYVDTADEVARIAQDAPWGTYTDRSGKRVSQPLLDPYKVARALQPAPERFRDVPPDPQLSADQESEIIRLTNVNLRKATYSPVRGRRDRDTSLTLTGRRVDRYLELAEDGRTSTYQSPGQPGVTVYEADVTEPGQSLTDDEIDSEVARFHDMASQLFGVTPQNDNGNRSYAPGPTSAWGQRTAGPWFSGVGG